MSKLKKILVVLGPTASGKSDLAVRLAKKFNGEVVSADSRQVYRGLNIGTGKITKREMRGVPHHLLDIANPKQRYTVVRYVVQAQKAVDDILARGKFPIVCGGTGFYIQALVDGIVFPDVRPNQRLRNELGKKSVSELFRILATLDPRRAKDIDPNNARRLIRAIEIAEAFGKVPKASAQTRHNPLVIGISIPKDELRKRIHTRLLKRFKQGMVAEAKRLHAYGLSWKRMDELGLEYRYLALYLQNKISKQELLGKLDTEIWHYAKRQMTWFRRDKRIRWFNAAKDNRIAGTIQEFLN